ncbi:unnamed protein product [Adineta steineri]|uniref:Uncharacterized protein n=1 Tax=Adineta steineri TaxID=433720 RepID=A0A818TG70_9BILA|nr:unnamed protein product [Adineta steineri]CAF0967254.1 unnamed protein product [Adineta steineri]CAF3581111.1 unnamed protein product [Adineta steineri]CAF3662098.1 unnamed protein product [Adineta steineri]CAF3682756.1 unnamed protein product [Adineta steineri]
MVSQGKEQAIKHLSNANLAFIAVLLDVQSDLIDKTNNLYELIFENIQVIRGNLNQIEDGTHFKYLQSSKGLKFKLEDKNNEENKQAAIDDDEVNEPKQGKTYLAILIDSNNITVLVEINPHDINEILQSSRDKQTTTI